MKLRPIAFACGASLAIAAGLFMMIQPQSPRTPAQEMNASSRAPSSAPPLQDPCHELHKLICAQTGVTRDPTGSVRSDIDGEQMAIDLFSKIAQENPDFTPDQVNEKLAEEIYTPRNRNRIESAFRWVRHSIEKFIDSQPDSTFTHWEKRQLKHRLKQIELQLPPPISAYADEPDLITKNDVYYERLPDGKMRLRVGGAYFFTAKSWFNTVFTMAHELAHGIDPCEVRSARLAFPAYDRLSACFMQQKLVSLRKNRFECGANDELSETFADWVAVHVTAQTLRTYSTEFQAPALINSMVNSVRDLCEPPEAAQEPDGYHPPAAVRIDKIFGRNPQIREVLGCEPNTMTYCSFDFRIGNSKAGAP
ncbi:MAG: hypothetical protein ACJ763_00050 [Bdellovibrionia bacterium]